MDVKYHMKRGIWKWLSTPTWTWTLEDGFLLGGASKAIRHLKFYILGKTITGETEKNNKWTLTTARSAMVCDFPMPAEPVSTPNRNDLIADVKLRNTRSVSGVNTSRSTLPKYSKSYGNDWPIWYARHWPNLYPVATIVASFRHPQCPKQCNRTTHNYENYHQEIDLQSKNIVHMHAITYKNHYIPVMTIKKFSPKGSCKLIDFATADLVLELLGPFSPLF